MAKQIPIMFIRLASRGHNPSHNLQCQGEIGSQITFNLTINILNF